MEIMDQILSAVWPLALLLGFAATVCGRSAGRRKARSSLRTGNEPRADVAQSLELASR